MCLRHFAANTLFFGFLGKGALLIEKMSISLFPFSEEPEVRHYVGVVVVSLRGRPGLQVKIQPEYQRCDTIFKHLQKDNYSRSW
ncbi:MAG: hypothetical protein ACI9S8_001830 [Chlamydiales bacterium]|jgi:hypothetical protein